MCKRYELERECVLAYPMFENSEILSNNKGNKDKRIVRLANRIINIINKILNTSFHFTVMEVFFGQRSGIIGYLKGSYADFLILSNYIKENKRKFESYFRNKLSYFERITYYPSLQKFFVTNNYYFTADFNADETKMMLEFIMVG